MRLIEGPEALRGVAADVCIVGSGPVGLCLALTLAERGTGVVVLESGLKKPSLQAQALSDAVIASPARHAPMALAVCRGLGGTSRLWGGRCVPLDAIDFERRDYASTGGWPIGYADVDRHHREAAALLGAGIDGFIDKGAPAAPAPVHCDTLERWTNTPLISRQLAARLQACPRLTVVLDATVVDLALQEESDAVDGALVASPSQRFVFRSAKSFVLALGGVETARLLLNVQSRHPRLFGGTEGDLGRHYMGHLSGSIADIQFRDPQLAQAFDYRRGTSSFLRRRLTLDPAAQKADELPNISFCPANPRLADPEHRSGILSAAYLALSTPGVGQRLAAEAIRQGQISGPRAFGGHLRNMILDFPATVGGIGGFVRQMLIDGRSKPLQFLASKAGRHPLHFHAEHRPSKESRIRLIRDQDRLGLRRASIDLRFSHEDGTGVVRAHAILERALKDAGIADLVYARAPDERADAVVGEARDGFHQIGSTRMAETPRSGIVDRNCRVFEFRNLFIAGTSVFPTSGQANPTLPAVALALRLADHLERQLRSRVAECALQ